MLGVLVSSASEEGLGGIGQRCGVGGGACLLNQESKQGRVWGGGYGGGYGVNRSWCPSICVLISPPLLVYLTFRYPPSRSQYSVLIRVRVTDLVELGGFTTLFTV